MPIGPRDMPIGLHEHGVSGHDIEDGKRFHDTRMIERHAMAGSPAAIVADDAKTIEAELLHHRDLIRGHRAESVIRSVSCASRL